jgi:hypothetical protein
MDKTWQEKYIEFLIQGPNTLGLTVTELVIMGFGFFFWTLAYIDVIRDGRKNKVNEMPMLAAVGNIAWEIMWAFLFLKTPIGFLFNFGCFCWFLGDIFINYQVLTKNRQYETNEWIKKYYYWIYGFAFVSFFAILYFMAEDGADNSLGVQSGLLLNLFMSGLYIYQMVNNPQFIGRSYTERVAVYKMLGTGLITISSIMIWPNNYYILSMGIATITLDLIYVFMFRKFKPALHEKQRLHEKHPEHRHDLLTIHQQLNVAK